MSSILGQLSFTTISTGLKDIFERKQTQLMFITLKESKVGWLGRWLVYLAVNFFGEGVWTNNTKEQIRWIILHSTQRVSKKSAFGLSKRFLGGLPKILIKDSRSLSKIYPTASTVI